MKTLTLSEARATLSTVVGNAKKTPTGISVHGELMGIVVSPSFYERALEALEDLEDIKIFDEVVQNEKSFIPWDKIKKELGLE